LGKKQKNIPTQEGKVSVFSKHLNTKIVGREVNRGVKKTRGKKDLGT